VREIDRESRKEKQTGRQEDIQTGREKRVQTRKDGS
jgi:hypothetical protein